MDLEQSKAWLSLAQQPYPVISAYLEQKQSSLIASVSIQEWLVQCSSKVDQLKLERSLDWLEGNNRYLINFDEFPQGLKSINSPPAVLFLEGNKEILYKNAIAIVGSRKPTYSGRENTAHFSAFLAEKNLVIISGMALGIDGIAHQAALYVGGDTIAVLGCGHHHCYPKKHKTLFQSIKQQGLVISEFHPDTPVKAYQFPRRNRIISGLSLAVLVVEAAVKSGSLITCRSAADQGRDVFAVPGDIRNVLAQGCHHLIQQGAQLVDHPSQIIKSLQLSGFECVEDRNYEKVESLSSSGQICINNDTLVLNCIDSIPTHVNRIIERSGLEMKLVLSVLFSLELDNKIRLMADGYCRV